MLLFDHGHDNNLGGKLQRKWIGSFVVEKHLSPHLVIFRSPETNCKFRKLSHVHFMIPYNAHRSSLGNR